MKSKFPIKKISRLNFWLTTYIFVFGFVTTMANPSTGNLHKAIVSSIIGALSLFIIAFTNLGLFLWFEKKTVVTKFNYKKKYIIASYGLSILTFLSIINGYAFIENVSTQMPGIIYSIIISILINTLVLAFQNYIIIQDAKANSDIENSQLKAANADTANQLLRQQIHPHFLFNALNILKSLYRVNPKAGEDYLIHLSDFLRAAVSNHNAKISSLKDEIKLCTDYLEMQKIRFGNALTYSISLTEKTIEKGFVPSFSIQPLLENAIKHNELTEETPLDIKIQQEGDRIIVLNNVKLKKTSEESTGSGLFNLSERYRILANDEIRINEVNNTFSVSIKILSNEDHNNRR